jgi:hypothetical protein
LNSGPLSFLGTMDHLYVGGAFTWAGDVDHTWPSYHVVNHVATWTGTAWDDPDAGVNSNVYDLAVYGDALVAGGCCA